MRYICTSIVATLALAATSLTANTVPLTIKNHQANDDGIATVKIVPQLGLRWEVDCALGMAGIIQGRVRLIGDSQAATIKLGLYQHTQQDKRMELDLSEKWEDIKLPVLTVSEYNPNFLMNVRGKNSIELEGLEFVAETGEVFPLIWEHKGIGPPKSDCVTVTTLNTIHTSREDDEVTWTIHPKWSPTTIALQPEGDWSQFAGGLCKSDIRIRCDVPLAASVGTTNIAFLRLPEVHSDWSREAAFIRTVPEDTWEELALYLSVPDGPDVPLSVRIGLAPDAPIQDHIEVQIETKSVSSIFRNLKWLDEYGGSSIEHFTMESDLLSQHHGRPVDISAYVVIPDTVNVAEAPVSYDIHPWFATREEAESDSKREALKLWKQLSEERFLSFLDYPHPNIITVFLIASDERGHHAFADSEVNGPWGTALTTEFIPSLEEEILGGFRERNQRFVTGHSSGGWSSLWLQTTYPDVFGACWSTSPDPIDFYAFHRTNIYGEDNIFVDNKGEDRLFSSDFGGACNWSSLTFKEGVDDPIDQDQSRVDVFFDNQMHGYESVFSPADEDGEPMLLFDRETGKINREVAESWAKYDIVNKWMSDMELMEQLKNRVHIWCGDQDEFGLHLPIQYSSINQFADIDVKIYEGACHSRSTFSPPPEKRGIDQYIREQMYEHAKFHGKDARLIMTLHAVDARIRIGGVCDIMIGPQLLSRGELLELPECNLDTLLGPDHLNIRCDVSPSDACVTLFHAWASSLESNGWCLRVWHDRDGVVPDMNWPVGLTEEDPEFFTTFVTRYDDRAVAVVERCAQTKTSD
jgi:hypothetical protein